MTQVHYPLPAFTEHDARRLAREWYGLEAAARPLPGERDRNFYLEMDSGQAFVLKIANAAEQRATLELQNQVVDHLSARVPALTFPRVIATRSGERVVAVENAARDAHFMRLLTYVPGKVWAHVKPHTPRLLRSLGQALALVDAALQDFRASAPAALRELKWDLARAGWIRDCMHYLPLERRALVEQAFTPYETRVAPLLPGLRAGLLYNDANEHNILVSEDDPHERSVISLIDYGDMAYSPLVCELAIGITYAVMGKADPIAAAAHIVAGYHQVLALGEAELEILFPLILARLCVSVTNAAYQRVAEPDNAYLTISEQPAWALLEKLSSVSPQFAHYSFRHACGLPACPHSPAIVNWLKQNHDQVGRVIEPDVRRQSIVLDLSVGSVEFGDLGQMLDPALFGEAIARRLRETQARVGIGQYNEARLLYTTDTFREEGNDGPERRTVHLGLDLFTEAGTPVFAPLPGVVHSFGDAQRAAPLGCGPVVILQHTVGDEPLSFFTLYGHLSRESLLGLYPGRPIEKGSLIGAIGESRINGGWPPHLHFQIISDLLGHQGEFPGVTLASQRELWLSLCPDPNLIAGAPPELFPRAAPTAEQILRRRREQLGRNLSIAYRRPLHLVRGWKQYLYDADGRAYLDAVNNVPHVGHCHPRVVRAGQAQMAVLNTNTRYLHPLIVRYAGRLCATLPEPLRVCFFVNSGSEAGELALRLARAHTGSKETIVLDMAYHGNTASLIEISPYKFNRPGGAGRSPHVHVVPMPDPYRGAYRRDDPQAGEKYARHAARAARQIQAEGRRVGAFIAESLMGSSGQIVLPEGFLRESYAHVRAAGGVCIADEVQVGFGRVGTHFWGFETQGVTPDIVVLGKPMGNGHPLGAVITTPEIAGSFANGMEYFSTFGGNPVSCAIGLAVLDVLETEQLQANAMRVGERLMSGFRELAGRRPLIGDVRGLGLFAGVELVRDPETLEPAAGQTAYVVDRLKERGILVSVDGPLHNVIKIKPPLCFAEADADFFVETLDAILAEDLPRL